MRPKNWTELGQNEEVEFDVHCKMKKCWANEFPPDRNGTTWQTWVQPNPWFVL